MRTTFLGCVAAFVLAALCALAAASEPAGIRDIERLVFEGTSAVSAKQLRHALVSDFNLALAAHPDASLSGFLRAVETATLLGYHHSGFRDAVVTARYDEAQQRIALHISEGERHVCGEVKVSGVRLADADALVAAITQPATNESTPWATDRPAPFDDSTSREIVRRLKEAFAAQGFYSPTIALQVAAEPGEKAATLEVAISEEGPRAEIGEITVSGNERDSVDDILNYLDLKSGQTCDSGLANRLKKCLAASGRFLSATIERGDAKRAAEEGREIVPLRISVREYGLAPPLKETFTAEQEALLKSRDWARRWASGETEYDLVFAGSFGAAAMAQLCAEMDMPMPPVEQMGIERVEVRSVIAPHRGQIIALRLLGAGDKLLFDEVALLHPDRMVLAAPQRKAKLEMPFLGSNQTTLNLELRPAEKPSPDGRKFQFLAGMTIRTKDHHKNGPLAVETKIAPAATISFLEGGAAKCVRDGEFWRLEREACQARLEAESGRLVELRVETDETYESPCTLTIRTEEGAFDRESRKLAGELAAMTAYENPSAWKTLLRWALDEWLFALGQHEAPANQVAAWKVIGKLVDRWSPPALAEPRSGGSDTDAAEDDKWFKLPWEIRHWELEDLLTQPRSPSGKSAAAVVLAVYRRLVPEQGWLWPVGRDLVLGAASVDRTAMDSLRRTASAADTGPLAALALASMKSFADEAAITGLAHLGSGAFRHDYQPLLSGDGWLSKWILSVAEALRSLDEADLRALMLPLCDEEELRAGTGIVASVIQQKSAAELMSSALDGAWTSGLSMEVAKQLKKRVPPTEIASRPNASPAQGPREGDDKK